ncbi:lasso peptide biosynthesis PqqD family chaperone [Cohnella zeiphila]|nr:lasso peptide biosynthesis PqqD family chaperone [Cohnella zeiphila]
MSDRHEASLTVVRAEGNIVCDMDGEKVMFSVATGKYYSLGSVGGRIWELIGAPIRVGRLVDELTEEFSVERPECERQVRKFLRSLKRESLIEVHSS